MRTEFTTASRSSSGLTRPRPAATGTSPAARTVSSTVGLASPYGGRRYREVVFPPGTPLSPPEERSVEFSVPMTKDQLVGLLGTYSGIITLEADQRAEFSRRVRAFLDRQPWDQVDLPLICRCLRSTRLPG